MTSRSVGSGEATIIVVQGLAEPVTIVHITDSHLIETDEAHEATAAGARQFADYYRTVSDEPLQCMEHLRRAIDLCNTIRADAAVFTGDMIHYPGEANVRAFKDELKRLHAPYLYTPGNHDWHMTGLPWTDGTRQDGYERLSPVAGGGAACSLLDVKGVRLIATDNSMYQVSSGQCEFVRQALEQGLPSLLLMHIPLSVPQLTARTKRAWGAPIVFGGEGWTEQAMREWQVTVPEPSTQRFVAYLKEAAPESLIGILSGHVHFDHVEPFCGNRLQIVTAPGFAGSYRIIRLLPA